MKTGKTFLSIAVILTFLVLAFTTKTCSAQGNEGKSVIDKVAWQHGPSLAKIDKWAEIRVPASYVFANGSDTRLLMEAMGNPATNTEVGFLSPDTLEWMVVFEFDEVGYIKDDEKDSLDADAILASIRRGTEESNKERKAKGFSALHVVGWDIKPRYNEITHNLEWATRLKDDNGDLILNHNTRLLGRKGVMRVTLVVEPQKLTAVLPAYSKLLDEFSFKKGQAYSEFSQGDKIAQYGLTALIAGGAGAAAAKLGFFKLIAKFWKVVVLSVVAFFATIWSKIKGFFGRKNQA